MFYTAFYWMIVYLFLAGIVTAHGHLARIPYVTEATVYCYISLLATVRVYVCVWNA